MKALVLAAGLGKRLRPLTRQTAKPALWFFGKPLAVYLLDLLYKSGVRDVCINLHYSPNTVRQKLSEYAPRDMNLFFYFEKEIQGTAGALVAFRDVLSDGPFFLLNGDILIDIDLKKIECCHAKTGGLATCVLHPPSQSEKYPGVGVDKNGRIVFFPTMKRSPDRVSWKGTFAGVHVIQPEIFDYLKPNRFQCIIRDVYERALYDGKMLYAYRHDGYWSDLGTPERYFQSHWDVLDGKIRLGEPGIDTCRKRYIGRRIRYDGGNIRLGLYVVVGDDVLFGKDVSLERTIIWPGVHIPADSLLKNGILFDTHSFLQISSGEEGNE